MGITIVVQRGLCYHKDLGVHKGMNNMGYMGKYAIFLTCWIDEIGYALAFDANTFVSSVICIL